MNLELEKPAGRVLRFVKLLHGYLIVGKGLITIRLWSREIAIYFHIQSAHIY